MKINILFLIFIACSISACSKSDPDYDVLSSQKINCPEGWRPEYKRLGDKGTMYYCHIRNGPVRMAEYGHLQIKGQYIMGRKIGLWQWFDQDGHVIHSEYHIDESK